MDSGTTINENLVEGYTTMDTVSDVLGINKVNMNGKLILVEERHESNSNFIVNSIILNALKKKIGICLVLFHNTFNHYHNMAMKFGYNLTILKDQGKVKIIEPMKIITSDIECINEDTESTNNLNITLFNLLLNSNSNILHNLFTMIKDEYHKIKNFNENMTIIIEDMSHIYTLGFSSESSIYYLRYLRSVFQCDSVSQLCIVMHTYKRQLQDCVLLLHYLKHIAHLHIVVDLLETGYSSEIHGKIIINWKVDCIRKKHNLAEIAKYIYTISDRNVKISISDATVPLA